MVVIQILMDLDRETYALSHFLSVINCCRNLIDYFFNASFKILDSSEFEIFTLFDININIIRKLSILTKKFI